MPRYFHESESIQLARVLPKIIIRSHDKQSQTSFLPVLGIPSGITASVPLTNLLHPSARPLSVSPPPKILFVSSFPDLFHPLFLHLCSATLFTISSSPLYLYHPCSSSGLASIHLDPLDPWERRLELQSPPWPRHRALSYFRPVFRIAEPSLTGRASRSVC